MRSLLIATALAAVPAAAQADPLADAVRADLPSLTTLYRQLHAAPELSFQESKTAAVMAAEARKAGFAVSTGIGGTGVVAVLKNGPGPVVMLRTDMDALPVAEQTGLLFASKALGSLPGGAETPVMHACGHDIHMTAWVGTLRRMAASKSAWSGTLVMIAQPAEEVGKGARAMIADGLFTRFPAPQFIVGFHDSASLPAGEIGIAPGYVMATVDTVDLVVNGVGGHGAVPQQTRDPVVLAARIVTALQTLVSREIDPQEAGVVTVGAINGGTKHNIVPDQVKLQMTVRSYTPEVRKTLLDGIIRIARGEAIAAGMPDDRMPVMTVDPKPTNATFNTDPLTADLARLFEARFGKARVHGIRPEMIGEDFGQYRIEREGAQSVLFRVGGVPRAKWDAAGGDAAKLPSLHSPFWAPDPEPTIAGAVEAMTSAALHLLAKR